MTFRALLVAGFLTALVAIAPTPASSAPALARVIVVLDDAAGDPAAVASAQLAPLGGEVGHVYRHALRGYSATLPQAGLAALAADRRVRSIELDQTVRLSAAQPNPPSYGLDRIDQRNLPLSNSYTTTAVGLAVRAYVIDTGLRTTHTDFDQVLIAPGADLIDGGAMNDCNGHGTHVAGTVGGNAFGVAKGVTIVPVRVFACGNTGSTATIIAGVDFAVGHHAAGQPAVANLSLGGAASTAMDQAVTRLINDGVSVSVAAGNGNVLGQPVSACSQSPARVAAALTVGASDSSDRRASFSNTGTCVDLHAPGVSIVSAGITSDTASASLSGTSMASPHVAGVAALYLQGNPGATPSAVHSALVALSTNGKIALTCGLFGCPGGTTTTRLLFTNL